MKKYLLLLLLLALTGRALADGGRLRFHEAAGPFIVTFFTMPDPLTPGRADFSVAIERPGETGIVSDAKVVFVLTQPDSKTKPLILYASHSQASTRFLQAANFSLPHDGLWLVTVHVSSGGQMGTCSGEIRVNPPNLITNEVAWQIAIVPILVLLFLLHQWRKRYVDRSRKRLRSVAKTI